jgi:hypothetical protein
MNDVLTLTVIGVRRGDCTKRLAKVRALQRGTSIALSRGE